MDFILDNLAIGSRRDAVDPHPAIDALLCVAGEIDIHESSLLDHKVPIVDMSPSTVSETQFPGVPDRLDR